VVSQERSNEKGEIKPFLGQYETTPFRAPQKKADSGKKSHSIKGTNEKAGILVKVIILLHFVKLMVLILRYHILVLQCPTKSEHGHRGTEIAYMSVPRHFTDLYAALHPCIENELLSFQL
jgi:hypothetical protein